MPVTFNIYHVENQGVRLQGLLEPAELDLLTSGDLADLAGPVEYDIEVEKLESGYLAQGRLSAPLRCQCARCLKPFEQRLELEEWVVQLPFEGEEAAVVVNDCVDLTPFLREDILLELPQRPLCQPECGGLIPPADAGSTPGGVPPGSSPVWSALDKLRF